MSRQNTNVSVFSILKNVSELGVRQRMGADAGFEGGILGRRGRGLAAQSIGGFGRLHHPSGRSHRAEDTRRGNHNLATSGHLGNVGLDPSKLTDNVDPS